MSNLRDADAADAVVVVVVVGLYPVLLGLVC